MKNELKGIREGLARMQRGRGRRFSPEIRRMIAAAAGGLRKEGQSWLMIGRRLGLPAETPRRLWLAGARSATGGSGAFVPVAVSDDGAARGVRPGLVLVSPGGFRVEGLDAERAADLLRRLG